MIKDPTAWKDDLAFYMTEEAVTEQAEAVEPLLHTGSKAATGAWVAMSGTLGGAFGAITISPDIRDPLTFSAFVVIAALLLRGLYPLTVRLLGKGAGWLAMFAFFWTALLGIGVVLVADVESRWLAYGLSVGLGAFIGMMYGSFPPDVARNDDAWMVAFLLAPIGAVAATYVLRHTGAAETVGGIAAAGALAAAILMAPMGALLVKLWNVSLGLADLGRLYLHNDVFAPKAVAYFDRAIAMSPDNAEYLQPARRRPGADERTRTRVGRLGEGVGPGASRPGAACPARRRLSPAGGIGRSNRRAGISALEKP